MRNKSLMLMILMFGILVGVSALISAGDININTANPQTIDFQMTYGSEVHIIVNNINSSKYHLRQVQYQPHYFDIFTFPNYNGVGGISSTERYFTEENLSHANVFPVQNGVIQYNDEFPGALIPLIEGDKLRVLGQTANVISVRLIPNGALEKVKVTKAPAVARTGGADTGTSSVKRSLGSPGKNWEPVVAFDGTTCYARNSDRSARTSLFRGRFLGGLFE